MTNFRLHETCKQLSWAVYQKNKPKIINGWRYKESISGRYGFYSEVYEKDGKVIIAIRGTDTSRGMKEFFKDGYNDVQLGLNYLPNQVHYAEEIYLKLKRKYGRDNIIITGHSLGGSIGDILGTKYGSETVTFGAYGTKNILGIERNYENNITNYGNAQDGVFVMSVDKQIGKVVILNPQGDGNGFATGYSYHGIGPHYMESYGDLSKGVEYKKEEFEKTNTPLFKIGIEYVDYNDQVFDLKNRVLYSGELKVEDMDEQLSDLFLDQMFDQDKFPTKKELDKRVRIGELIYVEEYTRSDGTKVSGYYRAYPRQ